LNIFLMLLFLTIELKTDKGELDRCIRTVCSNCRLNNEERRLWILNDESLYRWARREGVRI